MFVLDIETIPVEQQISDIDERYLPKLDARLKDEEKIAAAKAELVADTIKAKSLDPDFGRVIAIGTMDLGRKNYMRAFCDVDEGHLLNTFWNYVKKYNNGFRTITFNGLNFDLPYLYRRSLYHGIKVPCSMVLKRYSYIPHFDVFQIMTNWNSLKGKSLDFYAQAFKLDCKKTGSGDQVYGWYQAGELDRIVQYCLDDVLTTYHLYKIVRDYYPIEAPTSFDRRGGY